MDVGSRAVCAIPRCDQVKISPSDIQKAKLRATTQRIYHVIPYDGAWLVKRAGNRRASRVFVTRDEALAFVGVRSSAARRLKTVDEVVLHNANGGVEARMKPIGDGGTPAKK
jgi:hypothetical protein